jgi:DNA polymerase-4
MDAFFASVEQRDDPSLRGKPVVVGGQSRRGVVAAASYEVRPYGVRSAMPMAEALRRCPHAIVITPHHDRYAAVSADVFEIFKRYTPLVEGLSFDEAFLDVTDSRSLFGDGETIARAIKNAIRDELDLTASAGVAPAKFLAKIASDLKKPDGLVVVRAGEERAFLDPLPIERMWGIGPKAAERLRSAGFATFADLAGGSRAALEAQLGKAGAEHVQTLAQGHDAREVVPDREAVSMGAEETYEHDLTDRRAMELKLLELAQRVTRRMLEANVAGTTVTVKMKYSDFTLKTRQIRAPEPLSDSRTIYEIARDLLDRFARGRVRLLGLSLSGLEPADARPMLPLAGMDTSDKRRKLDRLSASIAEPFGERAAPVPAALLEGESRGRKP